MANRQRFRFGTFGEDADDSAEAVAPVTHLEEWTCSVCSQPNMGSDWDSCMFCNRQRGTWLCGKCSHLNHPRNAECGDCGRAREDADG